MARNGKWDFSKKTSRGNILEKIKISPGITASEIGNSTLVRIIVQDFIRLEFIQVKYNEEDSRKKHLFITKIGNRVLKEKKEEYENIKNRENNESIQTIIARKEICNND